MARKTGPIAGAKTAPFRQLVSHGGELLALDELGRIWTWGPEQKSWGWTHRARNASLYRQKPWSEERKQAKREQLAEARRVRAQGLAVDR